MTKRVVGLLALALAVSAGSAAAQETGTPVFKSPYRTFTTSEVGAVFSDPGGAGWALEGFYGYGRGRWDVSFQGGFLDTDGGETVILLGADARTRVLESSESFPLDGALTLGVGANIDGGTRLLIPIGLSLGRRILLEGSETSFVPYAHPVIVPVLGEDVADDVLVAVGLGVDIRFGRNFDIRVAGALGDYEGVSIGVAFVR